jgi:hypothetical protein
MYGESFDLYFNSELCLYEKDSHDNFKDYRYNYASKKPEYISNTMNLNFASENKITLTYNSLLTEVENDFINSYNLKCFNVTMNDSIIFQTLYNGTYGDSFTALIFFKKGNMYDYSAELFFKIKAYKANEVIKEEASSFSGLYNDFEYKSIGITLDSPCDKIEVIVFSSHTINMIFSEPILIKKLCGTIYKYDEDNNLKKVIHGTHFSELMYESNRIKDQIGQRNNSLPF